MGRGSRHDVGDDEAKWEEMRERRRKDAAQKKEQEENAEREARMKQRRRDNEALGFKAGMRVMVKDLASNKEKNGTVGTLVEFVASKDRWAVVFGNHNTNNFRLENLAVVEDSPVEEGSDSEIPTAKVYITNLPGGATEDNLVKLFGCMGSLDREPVRNAKGQTKGFPDEWPFAVKLYKPGTQGGDALVRYEARISARAAVRRLNGHEMMGSVLGVSYAGGGKRPRSRSRSRERLDAAERDRIRELEAVQQRIKDNEPISDKKYFGDRKSVV